MGSDVVVKVADPVLNGDAPNLAVPAEKVTLPVGNPSPDTGLTWAIKTVGLPSTGLFEFTDRRVVVAAFGGCETDDDCIVELQPAVSINPESVNTRSDNRAHLFCRLEIISKNNPAKPLAMLTVERSPSQLRTFSAAVCSMYGTSFMLWDEVRAPLTTPLEMKVLARPTAGGQGTTMLLGPSGVQPLGGTETGRIPAQLLSVAEAWLMVVENSACVSVTVIGTAENPRL